MITLVITVGLLTWLLVAALLALGVGRAVAVARVREQHDTRHVQVRRALLGRS